MLEIGRSSVVRHVMDAVSILRLVSSENFLQTQFFKLLLETQSACVSELYLNSCLISASCFL